MTIITEADFNLILLFKLIALVMANQRSIVIIVNVNTDRCVAKTVKNPATLHPIPRNYKKNFQVH